MENVEKKEKSPPGSPASVHSFRDYADSDDEHVPMVVEKKDFQEKKPEPNQATSYFLFLAAVNTIATIGIVFTNRKLFEQEAFRYGQVTFAAFHFTVTGLTLFAISRPRINVFEPKTAPILDLLPLATTMALQVIFPNLSLAYCSVTFYQVARILLTPTVVAMNYIVSKATIPIPAAIALVPSCLGVGITSYYDRLPVPGTQVKTTTLIGILFAIIGVFFSALYTVWVGKYHKRLEMTSMQLLFNQAPIATVLLAWVIPFSDDITVWKDVEFPIWALIALSGMFACAINLSQFYIINVAGPVSSTVVGHFKSCCIIALGWITSGRGVRDGSLAGILLAVGGIIAYSFLMHRYTSK